MCVVLIRGTHEGLADKGVSNLETAIKNARMLVAELIMNCAPVIRRRRKRSRMSTNRADPFDIEVDLSEFTPKPVKKPRRPRMPFGLCQRPTIFQAGRLWLGRLVCRSRCRKGGASPPQNSRRNAVGVQAATCSFNIKATSETIERFVAISGRTGLVFGETLEKGMLDALESQLKPKRVSSGKS